MKNEKIVQAFDKTAPPKETAARIYYNIQNATRTQAVSVPERRKRPVLRFAATLAACIALVALISAVGYAAYQKWFLPAPETYTPPENGGIIEVHERNTYDPPKETDTYDPTQQTDAPVSHSDQDFLQRALAVFRQAGLPIDGVESMTAVRQKNLYWDREEVNVLFDQGDLKCSVKFDAQDGVFIGMSGIDWVLDDAQACQTDAEAEALARSYYEALPVAQGYILHGVEKYDEQFYSYDFCREVAPELYSSYECVRISINPVSGRLTGCTVFYVPLLDDHEPGEQPLTQADAEAAAQACTELSLDGYVLRSAEQTVCLPNWIFTGQETVYAKASSVTRLCWRLIYERPNSEFADMVYVMVDLYTGEILGGDVTA